jgi:hypothetical protein
MKKHAETIATAILLAGIFALAVYQYKERSACQAKGGVYLHPEFKCIKAEVL